MRIFAGTLVWIMVFCFGSLGAKTQSWIRINQLGYKPGSIKVGIWGSKSQSHIARFELVDAVSGKVVYQHDAGKALGSYGPFVQTYRLNFTSFRKQGKYFIRAGTTRSSVFIIHDSVYKSAADFCLRYMRQQRSGYNPFLKDSCHTHDGYVLYGSRAGIPDSTYMNVAGGWHDASDYLQYATTSANATWHLLAAYRDFPNVFGDVKQANGLDGHNGIPDVLDEARWGLDWLLKMHPSTNVLFNQIADDRDHISMRIPGQDSQYNRGYQRPVYFITGEPQQRGQFLNRTTGTSSTAGKFTSAFALGSVIFRQRDETYSRLLGTKAATALAFATKKYGVTQTVSVRSPYIYEEDNWTDDLELAFASMPYILAQPSEKKTAAEAYSDSAYYYAQLEKITPWLGADTARHYQWYPFINPGHFELAKELQGIKRDSLIAFYRQGIERVWNKAKQNAFYRAIPFIWCSNNLTTSFAIQCYWYQQLTGDHQFDELEQANFDWLFGANPWGTSFVYGLPSGGDTPVDPHSAFTHLKQYPIDGGLVDGPVYGSIFNNLKGIKLFNEDQYAAFQSSLAVYHDDYGDYSTNEPTMDGTASLIYLLAAHESNLAPHHADDKLGSAGSRSGHALTKSSKPERPFLVSHGGIIRGDSLSRKIALVFTGDQYAEGGKSIIQALKQKGVKASFFFTGTFYGNPSFAGIIKEFKSEGHYLGAHSNEHLLYCDWSRRDSLLVTKKEFAADLAANYAIMKRFGISSAPYFLPPYEWYNDSIAAWCKERGINLIDYTPGTLSHADYTTLTDKNYRSSDVIYQSILTYHRTHAQGLNGFILLMHLGAGPGRTDKFYKRLPQLIAFLKANHYQLVRVDDLLH